MRILVKAVMVYNKETKTLDDVSREYPMLIDIAPCDDGRCQIISEVGVTAGSILFEKKENTGRSVSTHEHLSQLTNPIVKLEPPRWWLVYNDVHTHKVMLYPMSKEQAHEVSGHLDFIAEEETHIEDLLAFLCM